MSNFNGFQRFLWAVLRRGVESVPENLEKKANFAAWPQGLGTDIICNLAASIRTSNTAIHLYGKCASTESRCLKKMKDDKLINKLPSSFVYTITTQGLEQLRLELPDWYEFYMQYSNKHRPGGNEANKVTSVRMSEVHSLMQVCKIKFGPQKPSLENIYNGGRKNKPYDNVYYMLKELKYEKTQQEARTNTSRATGVVFTRGINALVYNAYDTPITLSKPCERETRLHMIPFSQDLFEDGTLRTVDDAIFIAKDDKAALKIINTNKGFRMIGDAIKSKKLTGQTFRYIPLNRVGAEYLKRITDFSEQAIIASLFSESEIKAAKDLGVGDAVVGNLICYEFVSCNVTKIIEAFNRHKDDISKIGIIADTRQMSFIFTLFGRPQEGVKSKKLSGEEINRRLYGKEKILE